MKRILAGAVLLVMGATQALATDPALSGSSAKGWLGTYVGAAVSWDKLKGHDRDYNDPASDRGLGGALFMTTNFFEVHGFVVGVDSDIKFGGADVNDGVFLLPLEQRYGASTRLRLGYAFANFLPFVTAGFGVGEFKADHNGVGDPGDTETFRRIGYVWGGGLDWAVTPNVILRAEYLRSDFGTRDINFYGGGDQHPVKIEVEEFRLGGAYKF